jgi:hypothetical protein
MNATPVGTIQQRQIVRVGNDMFEQHTFARQLIHGGRFDPSIAVWPKETGTQPIDHNNDRVSRAWSSFVQVALSFGV